VADACFPFLSAKIDLFHSCFSDSGLEGSEDGAPSPLPIPVVYEMVSIKRLDLLAGFSA
jgi:hypothetical protein